MNKLLYLPPLSRQVSYRAYADRTFGDSFLNWALRRFSAMAATRDFDVLYFDDVDESILKSSGIAALRSSGSLIEGLAEYAIVFGATDVLLWRPECACTPQHLWTQLTQTRQQDNADATRLTGWPCTACPTIIRAAVLAALPGVGLPPTLHPFDYLLELQALRGSGAHSLNIQQVVVDRARWDDLSCLSFHDAQRLSALTALPIHLDGHEYLDAWNQESPCAVPLPAAPPLARDRRRILFATPAAGFSGAEASLCQLASAIDRTRFDPHAVVGAEGTLSQSLRDGGTAVFAPNCNLAEPTPELHHWASECLRRYHPRIVHANSFLGAPLLEAIQVSGVPWIQHVRNASFDLLRASLHEATVIIAISDFLRQRLIASGVPASKIHHIGNSVDTGAFDPHRFDRSALRRKLDVREQETFVLMVARCVPGKRFELLIDAVAVLIARGRTLRLGLITDFEDPALRAALVTRVARRDIAHAVQWIDFQADIRPIEAAADILVLPSDEEAFGRCVIEAMSLEVPAVVSDFGGPRELVDHGRTGLVFPSGSVDLLAAALDDLVRQPDWRREVGRQARRSVQARWDSPGCARQTEQLYLLLSS